MPAGEAFTSTQADLIDRSIRTARTEGPLDVIVYVGELGADPGTRARELQRGVGDPGSGVLVAVDPGSRHLEIVTGDQVVHRLDDRACNLAALSMTTAFAAGDLAGGIATGIRMLSEHARAPRTLHTDLG